MFISNISCFSTPFTQHIFPGKYLAYQLHFAIRFPDLRVQLLHTAFSQHSWLYTWCWHQFSCSSHSLSSGAASRYLAPHLTPFERLPPLLHLQSFYRNSSTSSQTQSSLTKLEEGSEICCQYRITLTRLFTAQFFSIRSTRLILKTGSLHVRNLIMSFNDMLLGMKVRVIHRTEGHNRYNPWIQVLMFPTHMVVLLPIYLVVSANLK